MCSTIYYLSFISSYKYQYLTYLTTLSILKDNYNYVFSNFQWKTVDTALVSGSNSQHFMDIIDKDSFFFLDRSINDSYY
jgi:hypothetical protein